MGYTLYSSTEITDETNDLYRELLSTITIPGGHSLLTIWKDSIGHTADGELAPGIHGTTNFDKYFHEYAYDGEGMPRLGDSFTKTVRKRYDIAVLLSYIYNDIKGGKTPSGDCYDESVSDIVKAIETNDMELLVMGLFDYIKEEDIDIEVTQIPDIIKTFLKNADLKGEFYEKEVNTDLIAEQIRNGYTHGVAGDFSRSLDTERL